MEFSLGFEIWLLVYRFRMFKVVFSVLRSVSDCVMVQLKALSLGAKQFWSRHEKALV